MTGGPSLPIGGRAGRGLLVLALFAIVALTAGLAAVRVFQDPLLGIAAGGMSFLLIVALLSSAGVLGSR